MPEPSLSDKVTFLLRLEAYADGTTRVDLKETHMSYVFLTDQHAWKLKKPAREEYLDFSTLDARRRNAEREVTLNRRLASDVYEGIVPLAMDPRGGMHLGGHGEVVDWLVKMRRLPEHRMLDHAIAAGDIRTEDVERVASVLASFYQAASVISISASEYRHRLESDVNATADELCRADYGLPRESIEALRAAQLRVLRTEPGLFDERVRQGKVVDAHGDLRPEHICLANHVVIIDCLEFNADFRKLDPASELAFFALECERLGASWVGDQVLAVYEQETGDRPPRQLLDFYKRQHALTRAKIAVWHLKDSGPELRNKWIGKAKDYLLRAGQSISSPTEPPR